MIALLARFLSGITKRNLQNNHSTIIWHQLIYIGCRHTCAEASSDSLLYALPVYSRCAMAAVKQVALSFVLCSKHIQLFCLLYETSCHIVSQPYFHTAHAYLDLPLFFLTLDLA